MKKFSEWISKHNKIVLLITVILLVPSIFGFINTRINYDILSYLPQELESVKGQNILEDVYSDAATGLLIVDGMKSKDIVDIKEKIKKVNGVDDAIWIDDALDISIPKDILPDVIKNQLFSGDSTMLIIKYKGSTADEGTLKAIGDIKNIMNKQCFLSGMSAIMEDTKNLADKEAPFYVVLAVCISLVILILTMESTAVPVIFLISIGIGILFNMGTNIFLGEISYITKALAAVLQLGVTMDYSIFLMHRYDEELLKHEKKEEAMSQAISSTMLSISGSSLTTIAGFLALCAMDLTLGTDIGIVMAKGVIIGVITAVTVLPALILTFDKLIHRFKHKTIIPNFNKLSKVVTTHYKVIIAIFFILLIPAIYGSNHAKVYYNLDKTLPKDMPSIVATNKLKDKFNMMTTHFILVKDDIKPYKAKEMEERIEKIDGITNVIGYDKILGPAIPEEFIPENIRNIFKSGGYNLILANSQYKAATDEENNQIDSINEIIKEYDQNGVVAGEGALTKDLITTSDRDFKMVSLYSIIAIFLIILIVFKSISIPVLLVSAIEFAIFINMGIPYFTGTTIPFIASIVIGTIQLGATVDYAILLTSRFREELRNGHEKHEAILIAVEESAKSIVTSGLTFFGATGAVALVSDMDLIRSLCFLISRGAIISMAVILLILPSFLLVLEGLINKTSIKWKVN
ncbi:antibiotic ABC transporter permease [Clostridium baratii]|uniref:efflux RND transporter permease subunit n=1 Tax=Clostridium baratii TaxID=1561 RepID=UPI0009A3ACB4|nr:MMPL family transporter [Clostridium baratii]OPF50537.1 antibiotic ABC transporter permease [Clostridium baratii]OPF54217.1 antibiotic ABC transporter permease [Clostridium baratii]OPF58782.1 antibiotic ABC transporter permease [Clostridium baratii]OPF58846.1 antibiotic ABC transporter permease [Clostridium baratii]